MENNNVSPQDIRHVIEQQKKLQDLRARLVGVLDNVNQTINLITVENIELTSNQIENLDEVIQHIDQKPKIYHEPQKQPEEINQQFIDLELKLSHIEAETDDEELDL